VIRAHIDGGNTMATNADQQTKDRFRARLSRFQENVSQALSQAQMRVNEQDCTNEELAGYEEQIGGWENQIKQGLTKKQGQGQYSR
jgi:peptidoglycan hydrolase CwlO-like protein